MGIKVDLDSEVNKTLAEMLTGTGSLEGLVVLFIVRPVNV